jgi:hypothetical protein
MTQEALKQMYQLLLTEPHAPTVCLQLEAIAREALAQPEQEPVAHLWECLGRWSAYLVNNGTQAECAPPSWLVDAVKNATTPPQRIEQAPVAWPCHIVEADFSERTITLGMECGDYKVSAGTHWLSTTPPRRTEQEPMANLHFFKQVLSVAIAGLYEHYKQDVINTFSIEELSEVVALSESLRHRRVEEIYKQMWVMLSTPSAQPPQSTEQEENKHD